MKKIFSFKRYLNATYILFIQGLIIEWGHFFEERIFKCDRQSECYIRILLGIIQSYIHNHMSTKGNISIVLILKMKYLCEKNTVQKDENTMVLFDLRQILIEDCFQFLF